MAIFTGLLSSASSQTGFSTYIGSLKKKCHKMMLESYVLFLFLILYDMNVIGWTRHRVQSLEIPKDVVA